MIGSVLATAAGLAQFFTGQAARKRSKQLFDEFEYQNLANQYKDITPSFDIEKQALENLERQRSAYRDSFKGVSSVAALTSGLAKGEDIFAQKELDIYDKMMNKELEIQMQAASAEERIQQMREARSMAEIQSLQQEFTAGTDMQINALGGLAAFANATGTYGSDMAGFTKLIGGLFGKKPTATAATSTS